MTTTEKCQRLARIFLHLTQTMSAEEAITDIAENMNIAENTVLLAIGGKVA